MIDEADGSRAAAPLAAMLVLCERRRSSFSKRAPAPHAMEITHGLETADDRLRRAIKSRRVAER
jgi:hypothetical protein